MSPGISIAITATAMFSNTDRGYAPVRSVDPEAPAASTGATVAVKARPAWVHALRAVLLVGALVAALTVASLAFEKAEDAESKASSGASLAARLGHEGGASAFGELPIIGAAPRLGTDAAGRSAEAQTALPPGTSAPYEIDPSALSGKYILVQVDGNLYWADETQYLTAADVPSYSLSSLTDGPAQNATASGEALVWNATQGAVEWRKLVPDGTSNGHVLTWNHAQGTYDFQPPHLAPLTSAPDFPSGAVHEEVLTWNATSGQLEWSMPATVLDWDRPTPDGAQKRHLVFRTDNVYEWQNIDTLAMPQPLGPTESPTFASATIGGWNIVGVPSLADLADVPNTWANGQVLRRTAGGFEWADQPPVVNTLADLIGGVTPPVDTAARALVRGTSGAYEYVATSTFGTPLPQALAAGDSPTFAAVTIGGELFDGALDSGDLSDWPAAAGLVGQRLVSDGSGGLAWADAFAGVAALVDVADVPAHPAGPRTVAHRLELDTAGAYSWQPIVDAGAEALGDLSDWPVVPTTPPAGVFRLGYTVGGGYAWAADETAAADLTDWPAAPSPLTAAQRLTLAVGGALMWEPVPVDPARLGDLADVPTEPSGHGEAYIPVWNTSNSYEWKPISEVGAAGQSPTLEGLHDVPNYPGDFPKATASVLLLDALTGAPTWAEYDIPAPYTGPAVPHPPATPSDDLVLSVSTSEVMAWVSRTTLNGERVPEAPAAPAAPGAVLRTNSSGVVEWVAPAEALPPTGGVFTSVQIGSHVYDGPQSFLDDLSDIPSMLAGASDQMLVCHESPVRFCQWEDKGIAVVPSLTTADDVPAYPTAGTGDKYLVRTNAGALEWRDTVALPQALGPLDSPAFASVTINGYNLAGQPSTTTLSNWPSPLGLPAGQTLKHNGAGVFYWAADEEGDTLPQGLAATDSPSFIGVSLSDGVVTGPTRVENLRNVANAPSAGKVLTATGAASAEWRDPAGSGGASQVSTEAELAAALAAGSKDIEITADFTVAACHNLKHYVRVHSAYGERYTITAANTADCVFDYDTTQATASERGVVFHSYGVRISDLTLASSRPDCNGMALIGKEAHLGGAGMRIGGLVVHNVHFDAGGSTCIGVFVDGDGSGEGDAILERISGESGDELVIKTACPHTTIRDSDLTHDVIVEPSAVFSHVDSCTIKSGLLGVFAADSVVTDCHVDASTLPSDAPAFEVGGMRVRSRNNRFKMVQDCILVLPGGDEFQSTGDHCEGGSLGYHGVVLDSPSENVVVRDLVAHLNTTATEPVVAGGSNTGATFNVLWRQGSGGGAAYNTLSPTAL